MEQRLANSKQNPLRLESQGLPLGDLWLPPFSCVLAKRFVCTWHQRSFPGRKPWSRSSREQSSTRGCSSTARPFIWRGQYRSAVGSVAAKIFRLMTGLPPRKSCRRKKQPLSWSASGWLATSALVGWVGMSVLCLSWKRFSTDPPTCSCSIPGETIRLVSVGFSIG